MLNAVTSSPPEGSESPSQPPPADHLMTLARQHYPKRWSTQSNGGSEEEDQYHLRWESHKTQLAAMVAQMEHDEATSDMTVATKGASIPSHRLVLAAASPFFSQVLRELPATHHPVIVVKTAHPRHLRQLVSFCYSGKVTLPIHDVNEVLQLAEELDISGLKLIIPESYSTAPFADSIAALRSGLPLPSSPTRFPFTAPLHPHLSTSPSSSSSSPSASSNPPSSARLDEPSGIKRTSSPTYYKEGQIKKFKSEPVHLENDVRPHSNPSPYTRPPSSAPPSLPNFASNLFFGSDPKRPRSSDPPQLPCDSILHPQAEMDKDTVGLSVVPPSRLLQSPSPGQSSPQPERASTSRTPPSSIPLPPTSMALALLEPTTPSTPTTPNTPRTTSEAGGSGSVSGNTGSRVLLWRFLLDLLHDNRYTPMYIRWLDRPNGIFRIMESDMVAQLWGRARKNSNMNYEKMSRGMRTYYKRGILLHIDGTKLIYKFNTSDAEIKQRMQYYDLTQGSGNGEEAREQSHASPSFLHSYNGASGSNVPPVTSASSNALDHLYNPLLQHKLLCDTYFSLLRTSRPELY
ncbi:protein bric-a-brac 1-like [Eriocheir sinensis]|uniref:protein bric-a-brac 1-like n=1 Tax=Eriocheir sinensis TaxID=95602 RepID=UPI0021CACDEF|nr:protein bric-a-brac 1-like [Eriocheir sinensis]